MPLATVVAHWMSGVWPEAPPSAVTSVYGTACAVLFSNGATSGVLISGAVGRLKPSGAAGSIKTPADC